VVYWVTFRLADSKIDFFKCRSFQAPIGNVGFGTWLEVKVDTRYQSLTVLV